MALLDYELEGILKTRLATGRMVHYCTVRFQIEDAPRPNLMHWK